MNNKLLSDEKGSVLVIALMTITIITMICATSLYIASQNSNTGMQTAGWQQALTGAETGIDAAVRALNAYVNPAPSASPAAAWTNWKTITITSGNLPGSKPSSSDGTTYNWSYPSSSGNYQSGSGTGAAAAGPPPTSSQFNYLPSSKLTVNLPNSGGEGATQVKTWVTIDTAGMTTSQDAHGQQWYRVRSTSETVYPSGSALLKRVSNNRLDNDLRNTLALNFSRKGASSLGPTRTIEVVLKPLFVSPMPILLKDALQMSGGGVIDHFNSSTTPTATFLTAPSLFRSTYYNETLVGMLNANGSDLKSTYVYGEVAYSTTGGAPQNTTNIQGTPKLTTPLSAQIPTVSDPTGTPNVTYAAGSPPFLTIAAGTKANPKIVKINGNFTVPGGQSVVVTAGNTGVDNNYIIFWVTGNYTTSGSGFITQAPGVHATWYVDGDITTSGASYVNGDNLASEVSFVGVGTNNTTPTFTISGSGSFIGTIDAPSYAGTISGSGSLTGSVVAKTLLISGGASVHYDDALSGSATNGSYAFASWFEDNSDPNHKDIKGNYVVY